MIVHLLFTLNYIGAPFVLIPILVHIYYFFGAICNPLRTMLHALAFNNAKPLWRVRLRALDLCRHCTGSVYNHKFRGALQFTPVNEARIFPTTLTHYAVR